MNEAKNVRCDDPGCLSRATGMYLVGLGGMHAFYCEDHKPPLPPFPEEAWSVGLELRDVQNTGQSQESRPE